MTHTNGTNIRGGIEKNEKVSCAPSLGEGAGAALIKGSIVPRRSPGGAQVDHQGDGTALANRLARPVRHRDIRHHRPRVLFGDLAQDVLQHREYR